VRAVLLLESGVALRFAAALHISQIDALGISQSFYCAFAISCSSCNDELDCRSQQQRRSKVFLD
jgi:hypothetical protein